MTKLDHKLLWLQPFLKVVSKDVNLNKLKSLKGYCVVHKRPAQDGQIIKRGKYSYTITLKLNRGNLDEPNFMYEVLHTLAHELAHLTYLDHSPDHLKLTAKLLQKFATVLKRQGVTNTYKRINING